jgi:putative tricarboxylic transport membrane protein
MPLGAGRGEALFGAALAATGIFIGVAAQSIAVLPNAPLLGPRLFPLIAAAGLAALGLATVATGLRAAASAAGGEFSLRSFGLVLLGLVAFSVLVEPAGFVVAAAALFAAVARAFESRRFLLDAALGLVLAGAIFVVFNFLLGLALPAGDWLALIRRG